MHKLKKLQHCSEMALIHPALFLVDHLSPTAATRLANAAGTLMYAADNRRRDVACENIRRSGIADDEYRVRQIAKASFCHFANVLVDALRVTPLFDQGDWRRQVEMDVHPDSLSLLEKPGQGVILTSGHLGNWEVAAQLISTIKPVTGITRKMNNPYADRLLQKRRPRNRFRMTPKHDADTGRLLTTLKAGEVLALLMDQHARHRGMMIDFFGHPASTHTSAALLHLITGTPICFGYCVKQASGIFRFHAPAPIQATRTGNRQADTRRILEQLNHELEIAIRRYPEQYLWAHRRWR